MGLAAVLQGAVAVAQRIVDDVCVNVTHEVWTGQDGLGAPTYAPGVVRRALVEPSTRRFVAVDGREIVASHHVFFFDAPPVSERDRLTLPSGKTLLIMHAQAPPLTSSGAALCWDVYGGLS